MMRFVSILPEPSSTRQGSTWRQWPVNGAANRWMVRLEVARATPLSDKSFPFLILSVSFFPLQRPSSLYRDQLSAFGVYLLGAISPGRARSLRTLQRLRPGQVSYLAGIPFPLSPVYTILYRWTR